MLISRYNFVDELVAIFVYFAVLLFPSYFIISSFHIVRGMALAFVLAIFIALFNRILQELKEINEKMGR